MKLVTYLLIACLFVMVETRKCRYCKKGRKGQERIITVNKGAVVSDHEVCARIGRDVFVEDGSAVNAAIATLLCTGVMSPHSMGIGGGNFMVIYDAKRRKSVVFDGRETAPMSATQETFADVTGYIGPKLIGVPGEIRTYWIAHQRFGKLPWRRLFEPSIRLLQDGFHISHPVEYAMQRLKELLKENICDYKGLGEIFCDNNGVFLKEGSLVKRPKLAETFKQIANKGPDYLYTGRVAETMAQEIQNMGGIFKKEDFASYTVKETLGIKIDLDDTILVTHGAPSGGPVMGLILQILKGMGIDERSLTYTKTEALTMHKMIEAMKFAYGERSKLGDEDFVPEVKEVVKRMISGRFAEFLRDKIDLTKTYNSSYYANATGKGFDQGTAHVSVLSPDGDAVSVTSTINTYFGSLMVSESTGIIWNNELADFAIYGPANNPKSTSPNRVEAGKRPLSSMSPSIFIDKQTGNVRMIVGNAGGIKIITSNVQVAVRHLWMGQDIDDAVRAKRLHHQLDPNRLVYEFGFPQDVLEELKTFGHVLKFQRTYMSVTQAISQNPRTGEITGFADERKYPGKAVFYREEENVCVKPVKVHKKSKYTYM